MTAAERMRRYRQNRRRFRTETDDDIEAEINPELDTRRLAFLLRADQARLFAKYTGPIDKEVHEIAREASAAWIALVRKLGRRHKR